eukprot:910003-Pelagomonas_calceolata.AAC.5
MLFGAFSCKLFHDWLDKVKEETHALCTVANPSHEECCITEPGKGLISGAASAAEPQEKNARLWVKQLLLKLWLEAAGGECKASQDKGPVGSCSRQEEQACVYARRRPCEFFWHHM